MQYIAFIYKQLIWSFHSEIFHTLQKWWSNRCAPSKDPGPELRVVVVMEQIGKCPRLDRTCIPGALLGENAS